MTIHYFCHVHGPSLPHLQCMLSSIRRFDQESPITVVLDDAVDHERTAVIDRKWNCSGVRMSRVAEQCGTLLPWDATSRSRQFSSRDRAWMMQSCLPWWIIMRSLADKRTADVDWFVYTDSDTFHYRSIEPYLTALPETAHVAICRHWYPAGRENVSAGVYNNGILAFRNSGVSREHMLRWGRETIERWQPGHPRAVTHEQKLLDEWPEQLGSACVELPAEVNWGAWRCDEVSGSPPILKSTGKPLQSFHAHEFRKGSGRNPIEICGQQWNQSGYPLHPATAEAVYRPYAKILAEYI